MVATRANVEAGKGLVAPRLGDRYVYGGMFDQNPADGTDCSGVWNDVLGMVVGRFQWGRESEGATTESYRPDTMGGPIPIGGVGPFGVIVVARPEDIPADAVVKLAFHHGPGGGANSHMWGELDGMRIESAGNPKGLVTAPQAWEITNPDANSWAYLPGPIVEDGTPAIVIEPPDTLFADVSEWQTPVGDSYPYRTISIRSNDGTHRDLKWANNYAWCKRAADAGRLTHFYVYFVYRPGVDSVAVLKDMVGAPHPKMVVEIDIESWGGQITGNQSAGLNAAHDEIAAWLGDPRRVVGYGNTGDLNALWPQKPPGIVIRLAAYGSNPGYPGKAAHQYTDGTGFGGGLPEGCDPFGACDMNSADGWTATALAALHGIDTTPLPPPNGGDFTMADAQSVINQTAGVDQSGTPKPWLLVAARAERGIGDVVNDPTRGPWESDHNGKHYKGTTDLGEQLVTVAEQIAWTHTFSDGVVRDSGDVLIALGEFLVAQGAFTK